MSIVRASMTDPTTAIGMAMAGRIVAAGDARVHNHLAERNGENRGILNGQEKDLLSTVEMESDNELTSYVLQEPVYVLYYYMHDSKVIRKHLLLTNACYKVRSC